MKIVEFDEAIAKIGGVRYISLGCYLREQLRIWVADRQKTRWQPSLRFWFGTRIARLAFHILEDER